MAFDSGIETFMQEAFVEANRALADGEVPVGCIFVWQNKIVARGGNYVNATKNATRHAELICLDQALDYCRVHNLEQKEFFQEIIVFVTVEPCVMCCAVLHMLNVKEINFGCENNRFGGQTVVDVPALVDGQVTIKGGLCAAEAMRLLKEFYKGENPTAPVPKRKKCES